MEKYLLKKKSVHSVSKSSDSVKKNSSEKGPSQQVIQNILNYSKALSIEKSVMLQHIENILN